MRASEFINKRMPYLEGYLVFSNHFIKDRSDGTERNIPVKAVLDVLNKAASKRGSDLYMMPYVNFVIRTHDLSVGVSKQKDSRGNDAYIITTAHPTLKASEEQDVIYLEEYESK